MKNILAQYLWIFSITAVILVVAVLTFPKKEKQLEFIEDKIKEVQKQKEILTEKELKLKELAVQKEWEEVDNDNNK